MGKRLRILTCILLLFALLLPPVSTCLYTLSRSNPSLFYEILLPDLAKPRAQHAQTHIPSHLRRGGAWSKKSSNSDRDISPLPSMSSMSSITLPLYTSVDVAEG